MIIYEDHSYAIDSEYPDTDFSSPEDERRPKWVVSDNSDVAQKIRGGAYNWQPVEDEEENLIDIIEKPYQPSSDEQIKEIKLYLLHLDSESIRPLRAIMNGTAEDADYELLDIIEEQADIARAKIEELEKGKENNNE